MIDRSRSKTRALGAYDPIVSRRDILRIGGVLIPAGIMLPGWLTAQASTPTTFDFYISPSGNDANSGTSPSSPWAITSLSLFSHTANNVSNNQKTAGKRVGLMPGTYNVSSMMFDDPVSGALQIIGGTPSSPTYWASCDANGNYSPRTATLTALSSSGVYGGQNSTGPGSWDGPMISGAGGYPVSYAVGNLTIDGLVLTGFSYKAIRIGGASSGDGPGNIGAVTIQNCEIFGGNASTDPSDNCAAIWIDGCNGAVVQNNYLHNNISTSASTMGHIDAIIVWGPGAQGNVIQYNTCVASGNIYGKETGVQGTTIQYNYIDCSMYSALNTAYGIEDFTGANTPGLTQTTIIRNNIVLSSFLGIGRPTLSDAYGWSTKAYVYNNTIINVSSGGPGLWMNCMPGGSVYVYNNILAGIAANAGFGNVLVNPSGVAVWNYNLYPSGASFVLRQNSSLASTLASYGSPSGFGSGIASNGGASGAEANSLVTSSPGFANTGTLAQQYQLASGSPAKGTGSTTGTSSGSACDMGAWGNGATQIGCNFTSGSTSSTPVPDAPTLTVS
jgi:hypothetical protein